MCPSSLPNAFLVTVLGYGQSTKSATSLVLCKVCANNVKFGRTLRNELQIPFTICKLRDKLQMDKSHGKFKMEKNRAQFEIRRTTTSSMRTKSRQSSRWTNCSKFKNTTNLSEFKTDKFWQIRNTKMTSSKWASFDRFKILIYIFFKGILQHVKIDLVLFRQNSTS